MNFLSHRGHGGNEKTFKRQKQSHFPPCPLWLKYLMKPKVISTEKIYEGKVFDISIAEIDDNGIKYKREIVEHKGSAVIIPVYEDNRVALVRLE